MIKRITALAAAMATAITAIPITSAVTVLAAEGTASGPVQMEYLDRGTVAVRVDNGVYLSWRLLGTEEYDTAFDVYRDGEKIATVADSTNYTDTDGTAESKYTVVPAGYDLTNTITHSGSTVSGNAASDGLMAYAVKYSDGVLDGVCARSVSGAFSFDADFEPDKVFLWDGMRPAENTGIESTSVWEQNYIDIPVKLPAKETIISPGGETVGTFSFSVSDCSAADLDGDGKYEIIAKMVSSEHDVGSPGDGLGSLSGTVRFAAYKLDGTRLWENDINLGKNVYSSAHTVQFLAYDFNLDGKAELICQSSLGSKDAKGNYVSHSAKTDAKIAAYTDAQNESAEYRTDWGPVRTGEEFLTVFDGETGAAIDTIALPTARIGNGESFGDDSGNRSNRFLASVAYLDGEKPYAVYERGYYFGRNGKQRMSACGVSFDGEKLSADYRFDTLKGQPGYYSGAEIYVGNGNHNCTVADVDGDGKDEFITGALCLGVDDNNELKVEWCTFMEHGDALHMSDYDPTLPGLELFVVHEDGGPNTMSGKEIPINYGMSVIDAGTGDIIFHQNSSGDNGRGVMADIGAGGYYQITSANAGTFRSNGGSNLVSGNYGMSMNFRIFWDGDTYDELLDGTSVTSWNGRRMSSIFNAGNYGCVKINGTKSNPSLQADLFGDWREELVYPTSDGKALRVFTTTTETSHKLYTLMHDRAYRMQVSSEQTAYNQPPHIGYYISENRDMYDAREYAAYVKTVRNGITNRRTTNTEGKDTTVDITINFLDENGSPLREPAMAQAVIGTTYYVPDKYLVDLNYDESTKMCYRYLSGNDGLNVGNDASAEKTVNLVFRYMKAEIDYAVNAVDGNGNIVKTLYSGVYRSNTGSITSFGDYGIVGDDGKYYVLADTSKNSVTFEPTEENPSVSMTYKEVEGRGAELDFENKDISDFVPTRMNLSAVSSSDSVLDSAINGKYALKGQTITGDKAVTTVDYAETLWDVSEYTNGYSNIMVGCDAYIVSDGRMTINLLDTDSTDNWSSGWLRLGVDGSNGFRIDGNGVNGTNKWIRCMYNIDMNAKSVRYTVYDRKTNEVLRSTVKRNVSTSELSLKSLSLISWTTGTPVYLDNISVVAYN